MCVSQTSAPFTAIFSILPDRETQSFYTNIHVWMIQQFSCNPLEWKASGCRCWSKSFRVILLSKIPTSVWLIEHNLSVAASSKCCHGAAERTYISVDGVSGRLLDKDHYMTLFLSCAGSVNRRRAPAAQQSQYRSHASQPRHRNGL